ncbi:MFS transporter [Candidatus Campbellbacteria bacterium]|nr:MAG: MFS transporter [Candidatus Campbellbacteria bacterium]
MLDRFSISKSFWALFLFALFFKFGAGLHYTLLSTLGERVFPVWVAGCIISAASVLQMIGDVPAGMLLDKYGYTRMLKIFVCVFILAGGVLFFGLTPVTFIGTVILSTLGWLFFGPGVNAYVLAEAPHRSAGRAMGMLHMFDSTGVVGATALLAFVISASPQYIGFVISMLLLCALMFLLFVPKESVSVHRVEKTPRHQYYIRRHFLHTVVGAVRKLNPASMILALQSFAAASFYGMIWFVVPLAIAGGLAGTLPSIGLGVFDLAVVLLGAFFGKLADTTHKPFLVALGLFLFAGAGLLLGFNLNILFLLLGFIATAGDELSNVSLWAWLDTLDADHAQDGLVNGVITFFEDVGWAVGPAIAGALFTRIGPGGVIIVGASILCIVWLIVLVVLFQQRGRTILGHRHALGAPYRSRHKR